MNTYTFTPDISPSGYYRIFAWWVAGSNRSVEVDIDIEHSDNTVIDTVTVNQRLNGGQWNELGVFLLCEGAGDSVTVTDRNGFFAIADAVAFERIVPTAAHGRADFDCPPS